MGMSETSSNLSYMTSGAFAPKRRGLDVIKENEDQKDDEEFGLDLRNPEIF